jgi:hypothetical protein
MTVTSLMLRQPGGANALDFDGVKNTVDLGFSFERFVPPLSLVGIRASSRVGRVSILQAQALTPLGIKAAARVQELTVLAETTVAPTGLTASSNVGSPAITQQVHKLFPSAIRSVSSVQDLIVRRISIESATYAPGGAGSGPSLAINGLFIDGTLPVEIYGATHANGTTLFKANIENGTGDAEDIFDFTDADGVVQNQIETLTTSLTDGHLSIFIRDANGLESNVFKIDGVNVDATALTVSSSVPADGATGVATNSTIAITFSEDAFGVVGKDFYLYEDIDTTPVLVETFTFDDDDSATGDNGGSASIVDDVLTLTPGAMAASTQHSVRWEAGAVTDPWGNDIAANTGDTALNFTTAAAPSVTMPSYGTRLAPTNSGGVYTAAGATLGVGDIYVGVTWLSAGNARTISELTVNGVEATQVSGATNGQVTGAFIYKVTSAVASGDIVATLDAAAANGVRFFVWGPGTNTAVLDTSSYENPAPGITTANLNLNTETDGKILAVGTFFGTDAGTLATGHTGIAEISGAQADVDNNDRVTALEADVTTGETPRTVTANISASTNWMKIATVSLGSA